MQKLVDNIYILIFSGMGGMFMLAISFILIHIQSQNKFLRHKDQEQKLKLQHQDELLQAMLNTQEAERKRIGQDLHDDVGTALSNLKLTLDIFKIRPESNFAVFSNACEKIIDKVIQDVRHISHNLSPPGIELYGLFGAVEELGDFFSINNSIEINVHNKAESLLKNLNELQSISIYRIIEELINNTIKHANAKIIEINFSSKNHQLYVSYQDDGVGISPNSKSNKGMGLHNIHNRLKMINAELISSISATAGYHFQFTLKN